MYKIILLLLFPLKLWGQFSFEENIYQYPYFLSDKTRPQLDILVKGKSNNLFTYDLSRQAQDGGVVVRVIDLDNEVLKDSFKLSVIPDSLRPTDILPGIKDSNTIFVCFSKLVFFRNGSFEVFTSKDSSFTKACPINDSLLLLSIIYDFHPNDGPCALQLHVFNIKTRKIIKSITKYTPGITLGYMATNLVYSNNGFIYVLAGLSGRIFKYDISLNMIDEQKIELFDKQTFLINQKYEKQSDSLIYGEHNELKALFDKHNEDSNSRNYCWHATSTIYSKDFITNTIKSTRNNYSFVEKIIPYQPEKGIVLLTISHPGYHFNYRDVVFYDIRTNKVLKRINKWVCGYLDTLHKAEDYFGIDVTNSPPTAPYFYKNHAYSVNTFDPKLYSNETKPELQEKLFHYTKENGYQWLISKYRLGK